MLSFEFEVARNLAGNEGSAEGRFMVQTNDRIKMARRTGRSVLGYSQKDEETPFIPIVCDEFGYGHELEIDLNYHERFAGLLTFGRSSRNREGVANPLDTHLRIVTRSIGEQRPDFLAAALQASTEGFLARRHFNGQMKKIDGFSGRISLQGESCLLEVDNKSGKIKRP